MKASKYLTQSVLLDPSEMASLMLDLPEHKLYNVSEVTSDSKLCRLDFLSHYATYYERLCAGEKPVVKEARPYFSAAMSATPEVFTQIETSRGLLTKAIHPVVQIRIHSYTFSDGKFHSMVHGETSKPWGLSFSFPQIYEAPNGEIVEMYKSDHPNTKLFKALQKWVRSHTKPQSFMIDGQKKTATFRIGRGTHFNRQ